MDLEPHPVSGELELEDTRPAKYRRLDEETLHSRIEVKQFDLLPVYVWCEKDEHGGTEPGWKLADLRALDDNGDADQWYDSPSEANDAAVSQNEQTSQPQPTSNGHAAQPAQQEEEDDENDDYWAQYDQTPSRTPAPKRSPAPTSSNLSMTSNNRPRTLSEMDYFARYGSEVQPALDSHDPDEDHGEFGNSTLNGDSLIRGQETTSNGISQQADYLSSLQPHSGWAQNDTDAPAPQLDTARTNGDNNNISMPRAVSPTASIGSIDKLEEQAAAMSSPQEDRALTAIKQHISTDIKSLFRLAQNSGMDRKEFERVVRTELDVLGFMEDDD
jgi:hypothetical protein